MTTYYEKNKERLKQQRDNMTPEEKEKRREKGREYHQKNRDTQNEMRKKRDELLTPEQKEAVKKRKREYQARRRIEKRDELAAQKREYMVKWRAANPEEAREKSNACTHKRRAQKRQNGWEDFNISDHFESMGYVCGICGLPIDPALSHPDPQSCSIDHIIPLSKGGGHTKENVQPAHLVCNISKGASLPIKTQPLTN